MPSGDRIHSNILWQIISMKELLWYDLAFSDWEADDGWNGWRHRTRATYIASCNVLHSTATITSRQLSTPSLSTHNNKDNSIVSSAHSYKWVTFLHWTNNKTNFTTTQNVLLVNFSDSGLIDARFDLLINGKKGHYFMWQLSAATAGQLLHRTNITHSANRPTRMTAVAESNKQ